MPHSNPERPEHGRVRSEVVSEHGAIVIVEGELDLANASHLEQHITRQIGDGHRHLVIDLTEATFVDSMSLQTLLRALAPLHDNSDAAVVLAGASGIVERSLAVSGVGSMFSQYRSQPDAIRAIDARDPTDQTWRSSGRRSL